jgi:predicted ATPase
VLQSIRIQTFKSVTDLTLDLSRVNLLVGSNNAGKSSVLQALQFAVSIAQSATLEGTEWENDRLSGTLSSEQLVYSPLRDVQALAAGGRLRQSVATAIRLTLSSRAEGQCSLSVRRGKNRNIAVEVIGRALGERLSDLQNPFSVFVPGLAGIPAYEEFRNSGLVRRAAARGDANSVFRNVLWLLHQDQVAWAQFVADLQALFPSTNLTLHFDPNIDEHINARVDVGGVDLPVDASGTGVLQAVQILAYVNVYKPAVLILDEPDSHLHPDNQRKIARLLYTLAERRNFQVILSTHSRHVLDAFSDLDARVHWLGGAMRLNEPIDRVNILLELGALDAGDRLRNGATPWVVLTEDDDIAGLRALLEASGASQDDYALWSYRGCTKTDAALALAAFIREHASGTRILLHRDRDYRSNEACEEFAQRMRDAGLEAFVTGGVDVESHFLDPQHVHHLLSSVDVGAASAMIEEATTELQEKSIERMINVRVTEAQQARNRNGGEQPNVGRISAEVREEYTASPTRYRRSKDVLRAVAMKLQLLTGVNVNLRRASPAIEHSELRRLFTVP